MDDLAIIIPAYNEEISIIDTIKAITEELKFFDYMVKETYHYNDFKTTIYVYNNNSSDNTVKVVKEYIKNNKDNNIVLRDCYRQGKGYVIKQTFSEIEAKVYCMIDGDDTYSVDKLFVMYDLIYNKKADMVIGDRLSTSYFKENKRPFHNFGNKLMKNSINKLFKTNYRDILSGFRMFSYKFVKTFPITSSGFSIETEMNIHAANYDLKTIDVAISYKDRKEGSYSKLNTFKDGFKVIKKLFEMLWLYKPILFYNSLGLIFILLGIIFISPIVLEYCNIGIVPRFPTLIVSCFSIFIGIISIFIGQIQAGNNLRQKQIFELKCLEKERVLHINE